MNNMANSMTFSSVARFCQNIVKTYEAQSGRAGGSGFSDKMAQKSLEEYKKYIRDRIGAMPIHPSNMTDSISVHITDAGFTAMMNDSEYEKWVLDTLKKNFQNPDEWSGVSGAKYMVFHFGESKEELRVESWRMGFRSGNEYKPFNSKGEDSFWERRAKRKKQLKKELDEMQEKKAVSKQIAKSRYYAELGAIQQDGPGEDKTAEPVNYDMLAMQIFSTFKTNIILESLRGKKV